MYSILAPPPEPAGWWIIGANNVGLTWYQLAVFKRPRRLTRWLFRIGFEIEWKDNPKK